MEIQLPQVLDAKREAFLATQTQFIRIEPFDTEAALPLWTSKYRGLPYWPQGEPYPVDLEGRSLVFLAQINFAEIPKLAGYPETGILQFFISDNELYGLEFADREDIDIDSEDGMAAYQAKQFNLQQQQNYFRIVYHPEVATDSTTLVEDFSFLPHDNELLGEMPVAGQCRLEFSLGQEFVGLADYQFGQLLGEDILDDIPEDDLEDLWDSELIDSSGNKIGGYAYFTQDDVRHFAPKQEKWLLLLQIGSAENADICWGDAGVANFFIEQADLLKRDFSRVVYNWDCS